MLSSMVVFGLDLDMNIVPRVLKMVPEIYSHESKSINDNFL